MNLTRKLNSKASIIDLKAYWDHGGEYEVAGFFVIPHTRLF